MVNRHPIRSWLLTYPHNSTAPAVLLSALQKLDNLLVYVVAREEHPNGEHHLHAYVKFKKGFSAAAAPRVFRVIDKSGNYQPCRSPAAVVKYCSKVGDYLSSFDIATYAGKKGKVDTASVRSKTASKAFEDCDSGVPCTVFENLSHDACMNEQETESPDQLEFEKSKKALMQQGKEELIENFLRAQQAAAAVEMKLKNALKKRKKEKKALKQKLKLKEVQVQILIQGRNEICDENQNEWFPINDVEASVEYSVSTMTNPSLSPEKAIDMSPEKVADSDEANIDKIHCIPSADTKHGFCKKQSCVTVVTETDTFNRGCEFNAPESETCISESRGTAPSILSTNATDLVSDPKVPAVTLNSIVSMAASETKLNAVTKLKEKLEADKVEFESKLNAATKANEKLADHDPVPRIHILQVESVADSPKNADLAYRVKILLPVLNCQRNNKQIVVKPAVSKKKNSTTKEEKDVQACLDETPVRSYTCESVSHPDHGLGTPKTHVSKDDDNVESCFGETPDRNTSFGCAMNPEHGLGTLKSYVVTLGTITAQGNSVDIEHRPQAESPSMTWSELWRQMRKSGWICRSGNELVAWFWIHPIVANMKKADMVRQCTEGIHYFTSEEDVRRYATKHLGWEGGDTTKDPSPVAPDISMNAMGKKRNHESILKYYATPPKRVRVSMAARVKKRTQQSALKSYASPTKRVQLCSERQNEIKVSRKLKSSSSPHVINGGRQESTFESRRADQPPPDRQPTVVFAESVEERGDSVVQEGVENQLLAMFDEEYSANILSSSRREHDDSRNLDDTIDTHFSKSLADLDCETSDSFSYGETVPYLTSLNEQSYNLNIHEAKDGDPSREQASETIVIESTAAIAESPSYKNLIARIATDDTASTAEAKTIGAELNTLPGDTGVPDVSTASTCTAITSGVVKEGRIQGGAPNFNSNPQVDNFGGNSCQEVSADVEHDPQASVPTIDMNLFEEKQSDENNNTGNSEGSVSSRKRIFETFDPAPTDAAIDVPFEQDHIDCCDEYYHNTDVDMRETLIAGKIRRSSLINSSIESSEMIPNLSRDCCTMKPEVSRDNAEISISICQLPEEIVQNIIHLLSCDQSSAKAVIKTIERLFQNDEKHMSNASMGENGQSSGGIYQTITLSQIVKLVTKVQNEMREIVDDYPELRNKQPVMMDAGAGMHIPGTFFAILGGFTSIGLEIDPLRCALAAKFLQRVMVAYPASRIAMFNRDIGEPSNWADVDVYLFWDKVFTKEVASGFYKNVHRSMSHDIILIQSYEHEDIRIQEMEKYFEIIKRSTFEITLYKSGGKRDKLQIYRLKRKHDSSIMVAEGQGIVDESSSTFGFFEDQLVAWKIAADSFEYFANELRNGLNLDKIMRKFSDFSSKGFLVVRSKEYWMTSKQLDQFTKLCLHNRHTKRGKTSTEVARGGTIDSLLSSYKIDYGLAPWTPVLQKILRNEFRLVDACLIFSIPDQKLRSDQDQKNGSVLIKVCIPLVEHTPAIFFPGSHKTGNTTLHTASPSVEAGAPIIFDTRIQLKSTKTKSALIHPLICFTYLSS